MLIERRRLFGMFGAAALAACGIAGAQPKERVIRITARKFAFLPGEITLKKGAPVILEFVTADVVMGFNAPDFKLRARRNHVSRWRSLLPDCRVRCTRTGVEEPSRRSLMKEKYLWAILLNG